jgi:hypothetical protein
MSEGVLRFSSPIDASDKALTNALLKFLVKNKLVKTLQTTRVCQCSQRKIPWWRELFCVKKTRDIFILGNCHNLNVCLQDTAKSSFRALTGFSRWLSSLFANSINRWKIKTRRVKSLTLQRHALGDESCQLESCYLPDFRRPRRTCQLMRVINFMDSIPLC